MLKKLRQDVNISLKRQVRPKIFNVDMFFSSRGQEDLKKYANMESGWGFTGGYASPRTSWNWLQVMTIISLIEFEIKDPTYTSMSASYLDLHLEIDSENLLTKPYDKRDDSDFPIVNHLYVTPFLQHLHMEYIYLS